MENFKLYTVKELLKELDERNCEIKELKQLNEHLIIEKDELEYDLSECYTETEVKEKHNILLKKIEKLNDELEEIKIENDYLLKVNREIKQKNDDLLMKNHILEEELSILSNHITFNNDWKFKDQHELEQATLLVDNLLEQLSKTEKEVLTLSNDKKKLQLLNERMNNCITLQSQEIFKLLK